MLFEHHFVVDKQSKHLNTQTAFKHYILMFEHQSFVKFFTKTTKGGLEKWQKKVTQWENLSDLQLG